jgi:hypothetical protein
MIGKRDNKQTLVPTPPALDLSSSCDVKLNSGCVGEIGEPAAKICDVRGK